MSIANSIFMLLVSCCSTLSSSFVIAFPSGWNDDLKFKMQIDLLSSIWIWISNSDDDSDKILIPMTNSSRWSQFWYNFDRFQSFFDKICPFLIIFLLKDRKWSSLCQLLNQILSKIYQIWSKIVENNRIFDWFWPLRLNLTIFDWIQYIFDQIWIQNQIYCANSYCIVVTSTSGGLIQIKKVD